MIQVFDNLVPLMYQEELITIVRGMPFVHFDTTARLYDDEPFSTDPNLKDNGQFVNVVYDPDDNLRTDFFPMFFPILYFFNHATGIKINKITRFKINLVLQDFTFQSNQYNIPHVDTSKPGEKVLLYYVNDSDGDTILFDQFKGDTNLTINQRISPKQGRAVLFEANRYHAGCSPRLHKTRYAININFN
jgi:hypothetical protein